MTTGADYQIPFTIINRCLPSELGLTERTLTNAAPLLPHTKDSSGIVLWKFADVLAYFKIAIPDHLCFFHTCLDQELSLPFATFDDVRAGLDSRNAWTEQTLLNISRDYPYSLPLFRDGAGRAIWRASDLARYHCRLYGRREFDRTIRFEEKLRALTREREARA